MIEQGELALLKTPYFRKGPARLEGDVIVVDQARGEDYSPVSHRDLVFRFARTLDPRDAIKFAREFGTLRRYDAGQPEWREPFALWQEQGADVAALLRLYRVLQKAGAGDQAARRVLFDAYWPRIAAGWSSPPETEEAIERAISAWVSKHVSERAEGASLGVEAANLYASAGRPLGVLGEFFLRIRAPDLLTYIYAALAEAMAMKVPLGACQDCGQVFQLGRRQQRYCTPAHSVRARNRRRHENQVAAGS
jgi:hypothetical protein